MKIKEFLNMRLLILKARVKRLIDSKLIQYFLSFDITFIFVFLSLKLLNYNWNLETLLASFGLWIVVKEVFKYLRGIASEIRPKR